MTTEESVDSAGETGAVARAISKATAVAGDQVKRALDLLVRLGQPVGAIADTATDFVKAFQWRQRVKLLVRADEILAQHSDAASVSPPDFFIPIIDRAGNVDDPSLQELWAQLLASGVLSDRHRHPSFPQLLSQLSGDEAKMLKDLRPNLAIAVGFVSKLDPETGTYYRVVMSGWKRGHAREPGRELSPSDEWLADIPAGLEGPTLHHLESLGLIEGAGRENKGGLFTAPQSGGEHVGDWTSVSFALSPLGQRFLDACLGDTPIPS